MTAILAKQFRTLQPTPMRTSKRQSGDTTPLSNQKDFTEAPERSGGTPSQFLAGPTERSGRWSKRSVDGQDISGQPFRVDTIPLSRKRKRSDARLKVQDSLFGERLAVQYKVEPRRDWESLRRYRKFTGEKEYADALTVNKVVLIVGALESESIATGDFILVSHDIAQYPVLDSLSDWKAKVLEVRALDAQHVYVRVAWLNRPEDLPGGRQQHHGVKELMPTNQMDVINALAVNGTFRLKHYDELANSDQEEASVEDEYFWKQTFDFTTQTLSVTRSSNRLKLVKRTNYVVCRPRVTCDDTTSSKFLQTSCFYASIKALARFDGRSRKLAELEACSFVARCVGKVRENTMFCQGHNGCATRVCPTRLSSSATRNSGVA